MELCYHYCSAETFRLIISNASIHLSSTHNMNDFGEGAFIREILFSQLKDRKETPRQDDIPSHAEIDTILDGLIEQSDDRYVLCLSENGDTLSQWRGYANDATGVSIGFDFSALGFLGNKNTPSNSIPKKSVVNYKSMALALAKIEYCDYSEAESNCDLMINMLFEHAKNKHENSAKFNAMLSLASNNLFSSKHNSFSEEHEIRLMYNSAFSASGEGFYLTEDPHYMNNIKFKTRESYLIPYLEMNFGEVKEKFIKEINLGPKNKFHEKDLQLFLKKNGLEGVKVNRSASTYR